MPADGYLNGQTANLANAVLRRAWLSAVMASSACCGQAGMAVD